MARAVGRAGGLALTGGAYGRIDVELRVVREPQRRGMDEHRSQSPGDAVHLARLAVQGDRELLRWLFAPSLRAHAGGRPEPSVS